MCYIACMSKQYNTSEQSEEQQKTRERIITAASKVLAEKGYDATTLREISREAQAAPGLVHYYFGGKDQLIVDGNADQRLAAPQRATDLCHQSNNAPARGQPGPHARFPSGLSLRIPSLPAPWRPRR